MRFSEIFAVSLVAPLVAAHGDHIPGIPKIVGMGGNPVSIAQLKSRNVFEKHVERAAQAQPKPAHQLNARQGGVDGRCGPVAGGACCDEGYCCSPEGWCGQGEAYCMAPDCLFNYGPACDANHVPSGGSTKNTPRAQLGSVAYGGEGVYPCTVPGDVAITYDDGPYIYTDGLLDLYASYGMKATFFITGVNINKGSIDDASTAWPAVIKRMIAEGHQVASHTWSHQDLSAITQTQRYDQLVRNEMAFSNIIGKFPTYMRPPYSSCTAASGCEQDMADLGYVVSYFNLDSDDYNNITPALIQNAKNNVFNAINPSNPSTDSFLGIAHDIHQQTAQNLTAYWLDLLVTKGYRGVTMGECLGDPEANWYRIPSARTASTSAFTCPGATSTASSTSSGTATSSAVTSTATVTSPDSSCGGTNGYTCVGFAQGECCSPYGYCGNSADHCGTGCQSLFGNCGSSSSSSSGSATASSTGSASGTSSAPTSTASAQVSTDGSCGGTNGYTCKGSTFGDCCSAYGWCGSTADHCDAACNPLFGTCPGSSSSVAPGSSTASASSAPTSSASAKVSTDGSCGGTNGYTCAGSTFGDCCSQYGWCGSTADHCANCNAAFGQCASSSSVSSLSSIASSTALSSGSSVALSSSSSVVSSASSSLVSSAGGSASAVLSSSSRAASSSALSSSSSSPASSSSSSSVGRSSSSAASSAPTASSATQTSSRSSIVTTSSLVTSTRTSTSSSSTRTSTSATPTSTIKVSLNGKCGKGNGGNQTCKDSRFGSCCRFDGKCGNGLLACGWGCQKSWGKCW